MDWYSRKVLSWRLSNTLDTAFCVEALEEALSRYGRPDIFNTDQSPAKAGGSQFTSLDFTDILKHHKIKISMDGKGRWMDNVFIGGGPERTARKRAVLGDPFARYNFMR